MEYNSYTYSMTKDLYDKEIKWKNCLFRNRCPILDLNNGLFLTVLIQDQVTVLTSLAG